MEDRLIIGIDISKEKDRSCMIVARREGRGYQVINELFDKEAEDIYYKLINIHPKPNLQEMRKEAIRRNESRMLEIYSYKEILEAIDYTIKLKDFSDKQRNYILNHKTPKKIQEILAVFWLTHTNDELFNFFDFNWIPPTEIQGQARKIIDTSLNKEIRQQLEIPIIKAQNTIDILTKNIFKNIENKITMSSNIDLKTFINKATYE
jgi:hypothetical protein